MAVAYTAEERDGLHAKARAMLEACPDVGSFIRRGLGRDPEAETLVYLRTALDPAPVVTKAREFQGLLNAATRWLRRQGVGPRCRASSRREQSPLPTLAGFEFITEDVASHDGSLSTMRRTIVGPRRKRGQRVHPHRLHVWV